MAKIKHVVNGDQQNGWCCYECDFFTRDVVEAAAHDGQMDTVTQQHTPNMSVCPICGTDKRCPETSSAETKTSRHVWKFLADTTAKCLRCDLHVPAASAPFHLANCAPKPESPIPEIMMTSDEEVTCIPPKDAAHLAAKEIYQHFPQSFRDSDGDHIDVLGIANIIRKQFKNGAAQPAKGEGE